MGMKVAKKQEWLDQTIHFLCIKSYLLIFSFFYILDLDS